MIKKTASQYEILPIQDAPLIIQEDNNRKWHMFKINQ